MTQLMLATCVRTESGNLVDRVGHRLTESNPSLAYVGLCHVPDTDSWSSSPCLCFIGVGDAIFKGKTRHNDRVALLSLGAYGCHGNSFSALQSEVVYI